jgi:hypothetical protein
VSALFFLLLLHEREKEISKRSGTRGTTGTCFLEIRLEPGLTAGRATFMSLQLVQSPEPMPRRTLSLV